MKKKIIIGIVMLVFCILGAMAIFSVSKMIQALRVSRLNIHYSNEQDTGSNIKDGTYKSEEQITTQDYNDKENNIGESNTLDEIVSEPSSELIIDIDSDGVYHLDISKLNSLNKKSPDIKTMEGKKVAIHGTITGIEEMDSGEVTYTKITIKDLTNNSSFDVALYDESYIPQYNDVITLYGTYKHTETIFTQSIHGCYRIEKQNDESNIEIISLNPDAVYERTKEIGKSKEISQDDNGYYHLSDGQLSKGYVGKNICIYGKISDQLYGDQYSYPYITVNGVNCYVKDMQFNQFMSANNIVWTNKDDVYVTVYGELTSYGLFGGLISNAECIVIDNGNYYGNISLHNKEESSKQIIVTAEELLKLSENQNYVGINGATEEIYDNYNNKRCTVTGTIRDIKENSIYIDCDAKGYNYVNANTTTVVYYITDNANKYSIGNYIEAVGTLKCYSYAIQIIE